MYKITPKKGLKVINPATMKRVAEDGIVVPKIDTYWNRRKEDGDISIIDLSKKRTSTKTEGDK